MSFVEFKQLCKRSWKEDYKYLCIDRSKKEYQRRYCTFNENKNTYIESTPKMKLY